MIAQNMGTKIGLMEHIYFVILGAGCSGNRGYNIKIFLLVADSWEESVLVIIEILVVISPQTTLIYALNFTNNSRNHLWR